MAQPGGGEMECRLPIRERADDAGSPPDLAQNAFERIVATWVDRDEAVVSTRDGQAVPYDELRARVVIWPPSRLARVR
jgi:hypothetical protein